MGYSTVQPPRIVHQYWHVHALSEIVPSARGTKLYIISTLTEEAHPDAFPAIYVEQLAMNEHGTRISFSSHLMRLLAEQPRRGIVYCGVNQEAVDEVNARNTQDILDGTLSKVSMVVHAQAVFLGERLMNLI